MKILKFGQFNEAIIDYKSEENDAFIQELGALMRPGMGGPPSARIPFSRLQEIGNRHGIEIVDYITYYTELPDEAEKKIAPKFTKGRPIVFVNPVTRRPRIVLGDCEDIPPTKQIKIDVRDLGYFDHTLKHETIHVRQIGKMRKFVNPPNAVGEADYFKDKQEIMAFSQSISDMILGDPRNRVRTMQDAMNALKSNPLYNEIKNKVNDRKVLGRYKKYIYLYLKNELQPETKNKSK